MDFYRLKFQQIIAILLLVGYVVGSFSLPIVEGIHFLLHLGDDTALHSFYSHQTHQHSHQLLSSIEEISTDSSREIPLKNTSSKNNKKLIQQLVITPFRVFDFAKPTSIENFFQITIYQSPSLQINAPPPKV